MYRVHRFIPYRVGTIHVLLLFVLALNISVGVNTPCSSRFAYALLQPSSEPDMEPVIDTNTSIAASGEGDICESDISCDVGLKCVNGLCLYGSKGDVCGGTVAPQYQVYCGNGLECVPTLPIMPGSAGICLVTYTIDASPVTVYDKDKARVSDATTTTTINTLLVNTTLNFGMTAGGEYLWVSNNGSIQIYESIDDNNSSVYSTGIFASPLQCPNGFVVQQDDTLIFLSEAAYCAQRNGILVNTTTTTTTTTSDNDTTNKKYIFPVIDAPQTPLNKLENDITAPIGIAFPIEACEALTNPNDITNRFCVVQRGACSYDIKYNHCVEAGAQVVLIINNSDELPFIDTLESTPDIPLLMVTATDGEIIQSLAGTSTSTTTTLTIGQSVPLQGEDYGKTYAAFNLADGTSIGIEVDEESFGIDYVYCATGAASQGLIYATETADPPVTSYTINTTDISREGQFEPLFRFETSPYSNQWLEVVVEDQSYMVLATITDSFSVYDVRDPFTPPLLLNTTIVDVSFCDAFIARKYFAKGSYVYIVGFTRPPEDSESCPGVAGIGTYPGYIYDLSDPSNPVFVKHFAIPEVQVYTGAEIYFGEGEYSDIAAIAMEASGLVFYDFTDPLYPVAVSDVFHVNTTVPSELGYLAGVFSLQTLTYPSVVYAGDGCWYASVTPDGEYGTIYKIMI